MGAVIDFDETLYKKVLRMHVAVTQSNARQGKVWATDKSDLLYSSPLRRCTNDHAKECGEGAEGGITAFYLFLSLEVLFFRDTV